MTTYCCDNCDFETDDETDFMVLADASNLCERLDAGGVVPDGECNECGAFVYRREDTSEPFIQEMGHRSTSLGQALYIRIYTNDYRQLSWSEVWRAFNASYPEQWAVQMFPPTSELVDEQNIYHLFVLESAPTNLSIKRR